MENAPGVLQFPNHWQGFRFSVVLNDLAVEHTSHPVTRQ